MVHMALTSQVKCSVLFWYVALKQQERKKERPITTLHHHTTLLHVYICMSSTLYKQEKEKSREKEKKVTYKHDQDALTSSIHIPQ